MIVAITGGRGFIGERLVERHLQQGDQVRLLSRQTLLPRHGVAYFLGDLSEPDSDLTDFVDGVDVLYHCAGEINNETLMQKLHVDGTQSLVSVSKGRIDRWVQLSSVGVYGFCRSGVVTEESRENPSGVYEKTKAKSDDIVKNSGIPYVILRPSNVFGSTMLNQSLFHLIEMVKKGLFFYLGKKGALANYVHVEDVITALVCCGKADNALGKVYNLSQIIEIEEMITAFLLGLEVQRNFIRFPEPPVRLAIKLFGQLPGFPLTPSRINALTGRCRYESNKIMQELDFEFGSTLERYFQLLAKVK